ncbi:ankyrin and het domain-containing protein [Colletotrichum kahawae]|uniref:Ankyrin and het domain-containing protein n=1 Tax=Colletotrichum kahawae TaxID=34407 RepID=A0AAE0D054_COLKA|nr:ankyrin and het domain-containing protein [Colletotrichum kahawae]
MSSSQSANSPPGQTLDDISNLQHFQYAPLPTSTSIRLIEILPSTTEVIRCKMTTADLGEQPQYVCLSYTWGSPTTIIGEPAPEPEEYKNPEDFIKLPFVFESKGPSGITIHNTDYAMKYYVERHPWIPRMRLDTAPKEQQPIELDGRLIYVQDNLHCFLKDYVYRKHRLQNKPRPENGDDQYEDQREIFMNPLWIDALCINQADLDERASQVRLMRSIFRGAKRVLAWLGPPDGLTEDAIAGLGILYMSDLGSSEGGMTLSDIPGMDLVHWFAVFALFQRSWFRRAWVTQEAASWRQKVITIIHGGRLIPWEWICMISEMLKKSGLQQELLKFGYNFLDGEPLSDNVRQLRKLSAFGDGVSEDVNTNDFVNIHGKASEGMDGLSFTNAIWSLVFRLRKDGERIYMEVPPLLRVLNLFRGTDATDPRDKVFAFLNIASDADQLSLVPDYKASVQSVFRKTAEAILRTTKSLSIFSQVQEPCDTQIPHLPGWVPDFSAGLSCAPLDTGDDDVPFCASGPDSEAWYEIHDDGTIEVETIELDFIMTSEMAGDNAEDLLLCVLKSMLRVPHQYPIGRFAKQHVDLPAVDQNVSEEAEPTLQTKQPFHSNSVDEDSAILGEGDNVDAEAGQDLDHISVEITDDISSEDDGLDSEDFSAGRIEYRTENAPLTSSIDEFRDSEMSGKRTPYETRPVTRIEAMWRTLVGDMLPSSRIGFNPDPKKLMTHPAPPSLGYGFSSWIEAGVLEMWYLCQNFGTDSQVTGAAWRRVVTTFSAYAAIYRERHIPLTRETVEFSLEADTTEELAAKEEEEENWVGFVLSGHKFFPLASRLRRLLNGPKPAGDIGGYDGDPQAAINGQWREHALGNFTGEEREDMDSFEKRMKIMLKGRRLFTTRSGLLGVGPRSLFHETNCVYQVHIMKGAKGPYVLASYDDGTYRLIGEAYVHGVMNGELLKHMSDLPWCKYERIRLI